MFQKLMTEPKNEEQIWIEDYFQSGQNSLLIHYKKNIYIYYSQVIFLYNFSKDMMNQKIKEVAEEFQNTKLILILFMGTESGENMQILKRILFKMNQSGEHLSILSAKVDKIMETSEIQNIIDSSKELKGLLVRKLTTLEIEYQDEKKNREIILKKLELFKRIHQYRLQREALQKELIEKMKVKEKQMTNKKQLQKMGIKKMLYIQWQKSSKEVAHLKQEINQIQQKILKEKKVRNQLFKEESDLNIRIFEFKHKQKMKKLIEEQRNTFTSKDEEEIQQSTIADQEHPRYPEFPLLTHKIKVKRSYWKRIFPYLVGLSFWTILLIVR